MILEQQDEHARQGQQDGYGEQGFFAPRSKVLHLRYSCTHTIHKKHNLWYNHIAEENTSSPISLERSYTR